jgi:hypothetical protein
MPLSLKGFIAGFIATGVISLIFVGFDTIGVFPELDIVSLIDQLGSIQRGSAWVDHFIVGTALWGPIFTAFESMSDQRWPNWQKGAVFGVIAWLAMMLIFMPVVGGGWRNLFGLQLGLVAPVGMLGLHLVYGLVLGVVFDLLDKKFPSKELLPSEPPLPEMAKFKDSD